MIKFGKYGEPIEKYVWSFKKPKNIEWTSQLNEADCVIFLDDDIFLGISEKFNVPKIAWLRESKTIIPQTYRVAEEKIDLLKLTYDHIITHDRSLIDRYNLEYCIPIAAPWVQETVIPQKTKMISMFNSGLNLCEEHAKRNYFMNKFINEIDLYGRLFNPVERKEEGLLDYMFSIVVENARYPGHFSEKLTDCFASKTIPIYWGGTSKDFDDFFDPDGVIPLDDNFEISLLSEELYYSKLDVIEKNYRSAINFPTSEEWIYKNIIRGEAKYDWI